jgi:predicted enzyme related to lactoylglutathione lyase
MQIRGVDYVQVSARDLPRAVAFYRDTLGLPQTAGFPPDWYEFDAGGTTIALSEPPADAPPAPARNYGVRLALAVPDVQAALAELRAQGVPVVRDAFETRVCFMAQIADPEGNLLWLHQRKDGTAG